MSANCFPRIEISGTPHQRGAAHGEQLRDQIGAALEFYKTAFDLPDETVFEQAAHFQKVITDFNPDYAQEISAIAASANQNPLWIFALNARTEILALNGGLFSSSTDHRDGTPDDRKLNDSEDFEQLVRSPKRSGCTNECTSMAFPQSALIGQTWDWGAPLEDLCALMRISRPDGHVIEMLAEPGIIGKIGMNNKGLGVCLNILSINQPTRGLPIHVMQRAILDCANAREARDLISKAGGGKSSNSVIGDKTGDCFDVEYAGTGTLQPPKIENNIVHTNHYLAEPINDLGDPVFENSITRLETATLAIGNNQAKTVESMKQILSDRSHEKFPIYRPYVADEHLGDVGTVATFVMDLKAKQMHLRKGNADGREFEVVAIS